MRIFLLIFIVLLSSCAEVKPDMPDPEPKPKPDPSKFAVALSVTPRDLVVERGERSQHKVSIKVTDTDKTLDQAVAFLAVARFTNPERTAFEDGISNFADPQVSNDIFKVVLSGDQLREGVETDISYLVKAGAKLGEYNINVQLFGDGITDPNKVISGNRIGITNTIFEVR